MQTTTDFSYSKEQANTVCGIALIMMFIHHLWGFPDWRNDSNEILFLFEWNNNMISQILAKSGNLCVAIFAFNTGYVLFKRKEEYTFIKNIKRIGRFIISYWIIYFLFICFGIVYNEELPNMTIFLKNLFGFECGPLRPINVPFAWYVSFYVSFILATPIILSYTRNKNYKKDILFTFCYFLIIVLLYISRRYLNTPHELILTSYTGWISLIAYLIAKYKFFNLLQLIIGKTFRRNFILCLVVIVCKYYYPIVIFEFIYATLFIYSIINIILFLKKTRITKILEFIGVYSMNMWFLHGIFFTGSNKIQWLLYYPKYSILILIWGIVLTFPFAVLITHLQKYILTKLHL